MAVKLKETINGNITSADKLSSAKTLRTNLASTSAVGFDGSQNKEIGVTGKLPIANGGTNATDAATARSNLGINLSNLGVTATAAELNYVKGVTSAIQNQLNGKAASGHNHDSTYLKLTGGNLSGVTTISMASGTTAYYAKRSDTGREIFVGVGSGGTNAGVYDNDNSKWMVYAAADGNVILNGNANTATTATKLGTSAGSATQPVYFSGGKPVACTYTLGKSVPSNAVFTDTNTKVTQTAVTSSDYTNWRSLIWGASNSSTEGFTPTTVTDGVFSANTLSVQPSTGTIRATTFKGALSGNASTATTASKLGSSTVGSATKPIYLSSGTATACTYTLGSTVNGGTASKLAYYSGANTIDDYTSTIGGAAKPMYLNAGVPTACSSTVGSTDTPVYMNAGTITSTGKSFSSYLPLSGGTMTGALTPNGGIAHVGKNGFVLYPDGGYYNTTASSVTGQLRVTLPVLWTNTMMSFVVTIYNYSNDNCVSYYVGGYNYGTDKAWKNTTAVCIGDAAVGRSNLPVSFGHDGTKVVVAIGNLDTTWSYPQVIVHDVLLGYSGTTNYATFKSGWTVGFSTTALTAISKTISNTHVGYGSIASDSSKLGGASASESATGSTIVKRTANGYINATYLNQSSGAETPTTSSYIMYANSDGYLRKSSLANIKSILGLKSAAYTESSAYATSGHNHDSAYAAKSHTHNYADSSSAGGSATSAVKLQTARTVRTNLGSTSTASFDGSGNITPGVTGTLPVGNGGTGATQKGTTLLSNIGITSGTAAPAATGTAGTIYIQY